MARLLRTGLWLFLLGLKPSIAFAGWSFDANLFTTCPSGAAAAAAISLPPLGPFPNKAMCESLRSFVLSLTVTTTDCTGCCPCTPIVCQVGYKVTSCTGFDDAADQLGQVNPLGDVTGKPFFSSHYSNQFQDWYKETWDRLEALKRGGGVDALKFLKDGGISRGNLPWATTGEAEFDAWFAEASGKAYGFVETPVETAAASKREKAKAVESSPSQKEEAQDWKESDFFYGLQTRKTGPGGAEITAEEKVRARMVSVEVSEKGAFILGTAELQQAEKSAPEWDAGAKVLSAGLKEWVSQGASSAKQEAADALAKKVFGDTADGVVGDAFAAVDIIEKGRQGDQPGMVAAAADWIIGKVGDTMGAGAAIGQAGGKIAAAGVKEAYLQATTAMNAAVGVPQPRAAAEAQFQEALNDMTPGQQAVASWVGWR